MAWPKWFTWQSLREWRVAEIIGLVVAVIALVVGIYHMREIAETTKDLENVHHGLSTELRATNATVAHLRDTLSTRYLSDFPAFMPQIVNLVAHAESSVVIFCDIPGYGVFSDADNAARYCAVLEQKRHLPNFRLELTCMDTASRGNYIRDQFRAFDWTAWQRTPVLRRRLEAFAIAQGIDVNQLKTPAALVAAIQRADNETMTHTFRGRAVETSGPMPIYFWIADDKSAVFSIPALSANAVEYGFTTSDKDLILAFLNMKRRYDEAVAATPAANATTAKGLPMIRGKRAAG